MIETIAIIIIAILGLSSAFAIGMYVAFFFWSADANDAAIIPIKRKPKEKRKPKFVSEEEQWRKEQLKPPMDPGLEG